MINGIASSCKVGAGCPRLETAFVSCSCSSIDDIEFIFLILFSAMTETLI